MFVVTQSMDASQQKEVMTALQGFLDKKEVIKLNMAVNKFSFPIQNRSFITRAVCFVFERTRAPRHFLLGKGHPMRKL